MKQFVVAYMVDPVNIGDRFTMWPLHLTLLPWFDASDAQTVNQKLVQKLETTKTFEARVGERAWFGNQKLPVMLIHPTSELQALHESLLEVVQENRWDLEGRYTGQAFRPHVTQKAGRDASGALHIDAVHVVEAQAQGYREIVGKVELA